MLGVSANNNIISFTDNLTYDIVSPILEYIAGNLTAVESSIVMATDMVSQLNYLEDGFNQVSFKQLYIMRDTKGSTRRLSKNRSSLAPGLVVCYTIGPLVSELIGFEIRKLS
jgi:hypothetical protein